MTEIIRDTPSAYITTVLGCVGDATALTKAQRKTAFMLSLVCCLVFVFQEGVLTKYIIKKNLNEHSSREHTTKNFRYFNPAMRQILRNQIFAFLTCLNCATLRCLDIPFLLYILSFSLFFSVHCSILLHGDSKCWCVTTE